MISYSTNFLVFFLVSDSNFCNFSFRQKEHMESAKRTYEILNSELHDELPALYDSRVLFLVTNMQTLYGAEEVFHTETSKVNWALHYLVSIPRLGLIVIASCDSQCHFSCLRLLVAVGKKAIVVKKTEHLFTNIV
jgi:hypothetical protein